MNLYFDYEWKHKMSDLDFEIKKADSQLKSVDKRLGSMRTDVYMYIAFIVVPAILLMILSIFNQMNLFLEVVTSIIGTIISTFYIIMLPLCIYYLIKSISICILNNEQNTLKQPDHPSKKTPTIRMRKQSPLEREKSYQLEKEKLVWILHKYYIYKDKLNELKSQYDSGELTLSNEEIKKELEEDFPLYAEITPASPFAGVMVKKARIIAIIVGALFVICYFLFKP